MPESLHRFGNHEGAVRTVTEADDIVVLTLEGEFDRFNAPRLGEQLDRALQSRKGLILDLSEVTFIDSSVVNELFRAAHGAKQSGQTAVLQLGTAPLVESVLEIVRIESVLPRAHRRQEAVEIIERAAAQTGEV